MTSPGITTDNRPLVGAYGDVYSASENTDPPVDIDNPGPAWTKLGLVSEDGATWTPPAEETAEIKAWQSAYPVRIVTTGLSTSVQFQLMEWDRVSLPFALGGGTFTDDVTSGLTTYHPPAAGQSTSRALFLKVLDSPVKMGLYYAKGRISERGDATFKTDEAALLDCTFGIEGQIGVEPYLLIFDSDTFPAAAVAATGATAGVPGTFTPAGAAAPANLASMTGLVASPATAWTTGQYVLLGDASNAHWDSTAWVTGITP
jgi:hypothetical protein